MITVQDLYNIVGNRIANETGKAIIRNNFPPQIAEQMCNVIDGQERAEHFQRLLREYNEWLAQQQRQQAAIQEFLREYYKWRSYGYEGSALGSVVVCQKEGLYGADTEKGGLRLRAQG